MLFAGKSGKFFGTDTEKAVQTEFYSGDVSYSSFSAGSATESTVLKDAVLTPFTLNQQIHAIAELVYGHQRIQSEPLLADEQSDQQRQTLPYLSFLKRQLEDKRLVQRSGTR